MMTIKSIVLAACAAFAMAGEFNGDGTFYGAGGNGAAGACFIQPGSMGIGVTVAMNGAQFPGSCGKCVRITGTGTGQGGVGSTPIYGPVYALVDNECPECHYGDIDMGLSGDGRWKINWDFVSCDEARSSYSVMPAPTDTAHWMKMLRGAQPVPAPSAVILEPGFMVTKEGIRPIEEVLAEAAESQKEGGN